MRNIKKKIIICVITILICCSLTGCGDVLKTFLNSDISAAMIARMDANADCATLLHSGGFISDKTYKDLLDSLEKQKTEYSKKLNMDADEVNMDDNGALVKAISYLQSVCGCKLHEKGHDVITKDDGDEYEVYPEDADNDKGTPSDNTLNNLSISNFLLWGNSDAGGSRYGSVSKDSHSSVHKIASEFNRAVEPIVLVDEDAAQEINEKFAFEIWVLKPNIASIDGSNSIDGIMELLNQNIKKTDSGYTVTNVGTLNNYFEAAKDKDGNPVTLLDMTKKENKIIKDSEDQDPNGSKNQPGYDMIISQWDYPCMSIKFTEFDKDNIEKLNQVLGIGNECKYIFCTNKGINRAYLMEYPVEVLSEMEDLDESGENKVKWNLTKSGLALNVYTGKIMKYDVGTAGKWKASAQPIAEDSKDMYLTVSGADNGDVEGKSSFILKGMTTTKIPIGLTGSENVEVACGRIVLRDYLEATYAPGYDNGNPSETIHAFGRKLRIKFDEWEESDFEFGGSVLSGCKQYTPVFNKGINVAYFIDTLGDAVPGSSELEITDFCDFNQLRKTNGYVQRFNRIGEAQDEVDGKLAGSEDAKDISELKVVTDQNKINPVVMFPSNYMGKGDYQADSPQKQRFYTLVTTKGLFDSALFSSWIESSSTTASLDWWNKYLQANKFAYNVDHVNINNYLTDNFAYQLSQNGVVILDLETVAKIQEMYDEEADEHRVSFIKTFFVIVGWLMIVGSFLLLLLWVFDTNTDVGMGLLEKATMGNWIAVKYEDDIPNHNVNDQKYLTFGPMFIRVLIFIAIGVLLIRINIFVIVSMLIRVFGNIASTLERIIKGLQ